jgi:hypothetical protein
MLNRPAGDKGRCGKWHGSEEITLKLLDNFM